MTDGVLFERQSHAFLATYHQLNIAREQRLLTTGQSSVPYLAPT